MDRFDSLSHALEGWFEADLAALPKPLRGRVQQEFRPMAWDSLSPAQRRSLAAQWDQQHDPALEGERQRSWDLVCKLSDLKSQIERWELVSAPSAKDLKIKEMKLVELRRALARVEARLDAAAHASDRGTSLARSSSGRSSGPSRYIAYPAALARLRDRLGATPEELAAWIFVGPDQGGLAAHINANELDPPPRFYFSTAEPTERGLDNDYLAPMMACWFSVDDIERFEPRDRFVLGRDLIERWSKIPGIAAIAYIRAKIQESRLLEVHPIYGGTQGTFPEEADFPPMELGLFRMSDIRAVEAEDFGAAAAPASGSESAADRRLRVKRRVDELRASGAKAFLKKVAAEEGLSPSRIKQLIADPKSGLKKAKSATWISPVSKRDRSS